MENEAKGQSVPTDLAPGLANNGATPAPASSNAVPQAGTLEELRAALATERATVQRLQQEHAEQERLIADLWEKVFPRERVLEDLRNYPPPEQCHDLADLTDELRAISRAVEERRTP